jgi:hypothetical protein
MLVVICLYLHLAKLAIFLYSLIAHLTTPAMLTRYVSIKKKNNHVTISLNFKVRQFYYII